MRELLRRMNARRRLLQAMLAAALPAPALSRAEGERVYELALGDRRLNVLVSGSEMAAVVFVNVHENEQTSVQAARAVLDPTRQRLVRLHAQGRRNVVFALKGRHHAFDPNRIFSDVGIERTLRRYGAWSAAAGAEVTRLRELLLQHTVAGHPRLVVALHNNGVGSYSLESYAAGGDYAADAAAIDRSQGIDAGDFFLVTQRPAFEALAGCGFGVVLQRDDALDDGSLSVRLTGARPLYVNVEARHGHLAQQTRMLQLLLQRLA
jgi:hypothetical protein